MSLKRFIRFLLVLPLIFLISACGQNTQASRAEGKGLKIVTSFYPIYSLVKEISGSHNEVRMIQSGAGIHEFEPSAADVAAIYDADVFVYHSRTLESWAGKLDPQAQSSKVKVIEASEGMQLDRVEGLEDVEEKDGLDAKTLYDPHTWLDPLKVSEEASIIEEQLSDLDPQHAEDYHANAERLRSEMDRLVDHYKPLFEKARMKTFVTQHTAFAYLAKRFGLTQLGIAGISPEQEPSPRQMIEIQNFLKENGVGTIFVEKQTSSKVAESVIASTGAKIQVLDPLEADPDNGLSYVDNLKQNLEILSEYVK